MPKTHGNLYFRAFFIHDVPNTIFDPVKNELHVRRIH
jgi:hypothetical protein